MIEVCLSPGLVSFDHHRIISSYRNKSKTANDGLATRTEEGAVFSDKEYFNAGERVCERRRVLSSFHTLSRSLFSGIFEHAFIHINLEEYLRDALDSQITEVKKS